MGFQIKMSFLVLPLVSFLPVAAGKKSKDSKAIIYTFKSQFPNGHTGHVSEACHETLIACTGFTETEMARGCSSS